jgi:hypothetical protein
LGWVEVVVDALLLRAVAEALLLRAVAEALLLRAVADAVLLRAVVLFLVVAGLRPELLVLVAMVGLLTPLELTILLLMRVRSER